LVVLLGCSAEIPEARFRCADESDCPDDWYCVASHCQSTPGDAGMDAPPPRDGGRDASIGDAPIEDAPAGDAMRACMGPGDCEDDNDCTIDLCMAGSCTYAFDDDGSSCDDDLFCNGLDSCAAGVCEHAGDPCTEANPCEETNDWCVCNDGVFCTDNDHLTDPAVPTSCAGTPNSAGAARECPGCTSGGNCGCCNGSCVNVNETGGPCGACGNACTAPETCMPCGPGRNYCCVS
jgi:hypothetical protein